MRTKAVTDTDTSASAPTTPAPRAAPAPREDLARAILDTLPPRDRRAVYRGVRDFLRVLLAAHIVEGHALAIVRALDPGSADEALEHGRSAADAIATVLHASPLRHAHASVTAALVGASPIEAAHDVGGLDGAEGTALCRESLRALRRAYQRVRGST